MYRPEIRKDAPHPRSYRPDLPLRAQSFESLTRLTQEEAKALEARPIVFLMEAPEHGPELRAKADPSRRNKLARMRERAWALLPRLNVRPASRFRSDTWMDLQAHFRLLEGSR